MNAVARQAEHGPRDLGEIIEAYNRVTERLEQSHRRLACEVERLHDQLAEKNRELARREHLAALGEMAAGVAHEVRNPLGAIRLYASMLEHDLGDRADCRRLVGKIASAVKTLDGIVGDILTFAGGEPVERAPVAVAAVLDEVLALVAPQRNALQSTIHVDDAVSGMVVAGDATRLTRALLNLLFNALDAAGEKGNVWVSAADGEKGFVRIAVADDGCGVDENLKQRIFNPFFTTKDTGTGLGLSIVHRVAEAHDGRVEVGRRDGGGAVFTLVLPRALATTPSPSATRRGRADVPADERKREVG